LSARIVRQRRLLAVATRVSGRERLAMRPGLLT
jgi:hypothetical protein